MLATPRTTHPSDVYLDSLNSQFESLFRDAEGTHCSSFPTTLLSLINAGNRISQHDQSTPLETRRNKLLVLICAAKSFIPRRWAKELRPPMPTTNIEQRTMIAQAHKAAVTIYLSRLLISLYPTTKPSCDFEALVIEVLDNISCIDINSALFTATTWPTFIAGAETTLVERQHWVAKRLRERWEVEPWGLLQGARETLETIWTLKRIRAQDARTLSSVERKLGADGDWVQYLRETGVDWLIL
jgi:hypothetical protein